MNSGSSYNNAENFEEGSPFSSNLNSLMDPVNQLGITSSMQPSPSNTSLNMNNNNNQFNGQMMYNLQNQQYNMGQQQQQQHQQQQHQQQHQQQQQQNFRSQLQMNGVNQMHGVNMAGDVTTNLNINNNQLGIMGFGNSQQQGVNVNQVNSIQQHNPVNQVNQTGQVPQMNMVNGQINQGLSFNSQQQQQQQQQKSLQQQQSQIKSSSNAAYISSLLRKIQPGPGMTKQQRFQQLLKTGELTRTDVQILQRHQQMLRNAHAERQRQLQQRMTQQQQSQPLQGQPMSQQIKSETQQNYQQFAANYSQQSLTSNLNSPSVSGKVLPGNVLPVTDNNVNPSSNHLGKTLPVGNVSGKYIPGKSLPVNTTSGKNVPGKTVPGKTVPGKTVPSRPISSNSAAGKSVAGKSIPGKSLPGGMNSTVPPPPVNAINHLNAGIPVNNANRVQNLPVNMPINHPVNAPVNTPVNTPVNSAMNNNNTQAVNQPLVQNKADIIAQQRRALYQQQLKQQQKFLGVTPEQFEKLTPQQQQMLRAQMLRRKAKTQKYYESDEELLKKFENSPPSIDFHIHEGYFKFGNSDNMIPKTDSTIREFLKFIARKQIPEALVEILKDGNITLYDGNVILRVLDHRLKKSDTSSTVPSTNFIDSTSKQPQQNQEEFNKSNEEQKSTRTYKEYRTILRLTPQAMYEDFCLSTDTQMFGDAFVLTYESEILAARIRSINLQPARNPYLEDKLLQPIEEMMIPIYDETTDKMIFPHREDMREVINEMITKKRKRINQETYPYKPLHQDNAQSNVKYEKLMLLMSESTPHSNLPANKQSVEIPRFERLRFIESLRHQAQLRKEQATNNALTAQSPPVSSYTGFNSINSSVMNQRPFSNMGNPEQNSTKDPHANSGTVNSASDSKNKAGAKSKAAPKKKNDKPKKPRKPTKKQLAAQAAAEAANNGTPLPDTVEPPKKKRAPAKKKATTTSNNTPN
ncbi:hypothetical protein CANINC_004306 [Pichia inconspicua]|uniref:Spt20-like SEP domain-containing protein n=1 Tax=Pichia inconspicua TaxID=52247 RepID=A0A4T0WWI5_9ASCO|nr:hypothetical protein CANINC_004306 [[Candida] inconspicua]